MTQQIVGNLFDPLYHADRATWKAAELLDQFRDGFSPIQIVWQLTGQLRRARDLLVARAKDDRWTMHGTAIGVHGVVQALARMRALRALPTAGSLSDEAVLWQSLTPPKQVPRTVEARFETPLVAERLEHRDHSHVEARNRRTAGAGRRDGVHARSLERLSSARLRHGIAASRLAPELTGGRRRMTEEIASAAAESVTPAAAKDVIFTPLKFNNLEVKNRIFRSSVSGRFDNEDGSLTQTRINWECKFAKGGIGAIISSYVPVLMEGRIIAGYATVHRDDFIPYWQKLGEAVHSFDCKFIMQLSHSGRQMDVPGVHNYARPTLSSTSKKESLHGFLCRAMTIAEIHHTIDAFAKGAWRAREAGLDGVELHAANGYLFTQFLSSGINDRTDDYGGSLTNRARFLLDVISAIRAEVGSKFHLQVKISAVDHNNVVPWEKKGNTLSESVQIAQVVRGGRRRCAACLDRQPISASLQSARRLFVRDHRRDLRRDDLVGDKHVAQLFPVPLSDPAADLSLGLVPHEARPAGGRRRRGRRPRHQGRGQDPGDLHRRVADRLENPRCDQFRGLRRRIDRTLADRQSQSAEILGRRRTICRRRPAPIAIAACSMRRKIRWAAMSRCALPITTAMVEQLMTIYNTHPTLQVPTPQRGGRHDPRTAGHSRPGCAAPALASPHPGLHLAGDHRR